MKAISTLLLGLSLTAFVPVQPAAQDTTRVNVYRFVLGVDVPESPALVALGVSPTHVLRGSAPKPIAVSLLNTFSSREGGASALAIDVAPYFVGGGGARRLADYRSSTIRGRLTRVLTKTLVSLGAVRTSGDSPSTEVGVGVRATFHDPHDPVLKSRLPEEVARLLDEHGVPPVAGVEEDVADRGVDLAPAFARARRAMRARGGFDPQVSGGWGMAAPLHGGDRDGEGLGPFHHTLWLCGQFTPDARFDLLSTVQARDAFRSGTSFWIGGGLQRKTTAMDVIAELYYDTRRRNFYPGVTVDYRVFPTLGLTASLTTHDARGSLAEAGEPALALHTSLRWFYASDR